MSISMTTHATVLCMFEAILDSIAVQKFIGSSSKVHIAHVHESFVNDPDKPGTNENENEQADDGISVEESGS